MYRARIQRTGIHTQVAKNQLWKAVSQAKDLGELLPLVDRLSRETESLMKSRSLSESDMRRIVAPLVKIRLLLTMIASPEYGSGKINKEDARIRDMVERYLDIEGRIKELRNDFARRAKPHVP